MQPFPERVERLRSSILSPWSQSSASARQLVQILGAMESMVPAVPLTVVYIRPFLREFRARWTQSLLPWDPQVSLVL